jgi:hypothetical protein
MTIVAQGIGKTVAFIKQSALGTPGSGAGSTYLRRITSIFSANRATFANNEIATHQQSTGVSYGMKSVTGKVSSLLSSGSYAPFFGSLLRKLFVVGVNTGAIITVTSASTSGNQGTFTRSAGSYLTDGFKLFDVVRWTGWATTGVSNNNRNFLIIGLTATVMTVAAFDTAAVGAKAAGDSVTCTVTGKKTFAPTTGHTNEYWTFEDWYADVGKSELFTDCKVSQIDVGLPASGNATISIDFMGLNRTLGAAQVLTSPTASPTTSDMTSSNGAIYANGAVVGNITGATLTITGNLQAGEAVLGSNNAVDIGRGRIAVSGSFTGLFTDSVLTALYDAETPISLAIALVDNPQVGTSDFIVFNIPLIKLTGDAPDDGEKTIVRTYPFTAQFNAAGGAGVNTDQTIIAIQDSAA